jgi:cell division protein FtsL
MDSKPKKAIVMEDDFVDNSERPFAELHRSAPARAQWSLDQYLTWQFLVPTIILGISTLYILHRLNVFQVIWVLMVGLLLLALSVIIVAYLDNSLTAESADLVTRIDLRDWKTVRAALQRSNNSPAANTAAQEDEDDDDIFDGSPPFFGHNSAPTTNIEDIKLQVLQGALQAMKSDLLNHIDNQRRHANIQVVMGILATLVGIAVLVAASLNKVGSISMSYSQVIVAAVISIFVLFFLNQYQNTQQRIKFFQNELTNLNARIAAFQLAYLLDDDKSAIQMLLKDLISTERNFKMSKNEMLS